MPSTPFTDAYVKYLTQFPTKESLGAGDPPATWAAELAKQQPEAFDAVKALNISLEGGNVSGVSNFSAIHHVRALYAVRQARDPDFVNPYTQPIPEPMIGKRMGTLVQLGL